MGRTISIDIRNTLFYVLPIFGCTMKKVRLRRGYLFSRFAGAADSRIIQVPLPSRLVVPLAQGYGKESPARVKKGDSVKTGQALNGDRETISTPVVSPAGGRVAGLQKHAVIIEPEAGGAPVPAAPGPPRPDWENLAAEDVRNILYECGITALGREGLPSEGKSSPVSPPDLKHLIVCCLEDDIFNISWSAVLDGERGGQAALGISILHKAYPNAKIHCVIDRRCAPLMHKLKSLDPQRTWLEVSAESPRFPLHTPEIIIPHVLGADVPWGYSPIHMGIVVTDIQTALHCYEAVALGKPLVERIIALSGPGFRENPHVRVRIGTPVSHIVKDYLKTDVNSRLVLNSPLMGEALSDPSRPVDITFSQIIALPENTGREFLAFMRPGPRRDSFSNTFLAAYLPTARRADTNMHGEERACIYCGYCEQVCPVNIIPHLIYHHVKRINVAEYLLQLKIFKCMHCNLCNYVCPVKLPLSQGIKQGQEKLIEAGCDPTIGMIPYYDLDGFNAYRGRK
jgi:electron transport complex protein RnfC